MHEHAPPPPLRSPFWPVIAKCLAKRPTDRFANMSEFREAIEAVASGNKFQVPRQPEAENDIWAYRDKGNTLFRLGKYGDAIAAFDKFLAVFPDGSARFNRACCLENLGRFKEAMELYQEFAKHGDYKAYVNGTNCLINLGDRASAIEFADRATQLKPEDDDCWIALGNAKYAVANFQEAIAAYRRAMALSPSEPTPHYNLALARWRAGDLHGAARSIKRFLHFATPLDDRRPNAKNLLKKVTDSQNSGQDR
jgi:tetratricopeptide (TPR) repeat protein